ncbi:MAG TPA: nickel-dependent hydrogenase large subunit [Burkholderiales bacterium]|nr:nickel-dependent hydrogenase large subunit [Burkholderiales bacterium]
MGIEGALHLQVRWDGRRVQGLEIASTRAVAASRVLEGKTPREAVALVPMLFSLCGRAQGVAALRAWEAALGAAPDAGATRARNWAVAAEAAQENLWRLMLDWPQALGEAPATESFASWRRRLSALATALMKTEGWSEPGAPVAAPERELAAMGAELAQFVGAELLGMDAKAWLAAPALQEWWEKAGSPAARMLQRLFEGEGLAGRSTVALMDAASARALARVVERTLREPGYAARPDWDGAARETGALARMASHPAIAGALALHGNCIAVRVLARLAETAALAHQLAGGAQAPLVDGMAPAARTGAAWVETSRGLLAHVMELENGCIARYRILAPTEWNFHPDGPLAMGLAGMEADSEPALARAVRLQALALDPCVACETEIARA